MNQQYAGRYVHEIISVRCGTLSTVIYSAHNVGVKKSVLNSVIMTPRFDSVTFTNSTRYNKVNLVDFAAREISDVGMCQRVAKGARRTSTGRDVKRTSVGKDSGGDSAKGGGRRGTKCGSVRQF